MGLSGGGTVRAGMLLAVSVGVSGGCGGGERVAPLAPSSPVAVPSPSSTVTLVSLVLHTTGRYCDGCTVEVLDGPAAGTSARTNAQGRVQFQIRDAGQTVTLRASKDGYQPATQVTSHTGSTPWTVWFTLESVTPPLNLAGDYTMSITADGCAAMPESLRSRTYRVRLSPHTARPATTFTTQPDGGTFDAFEAFWGVSGNEVAMLASRGDEGEWPGIVERLPDGNKPRVALLERSDRDGRRRRDGRRGYRHAIVLQCRHAFELHARLYATPALHEAEVTSWKGTR